MTPVATPPPKIIAGFLDRIARRSSIRRTLVVILSLTLAPLVLFAFVQGGLRLTNERKIFKEQLVISAERAATVEQDRLNQIHYGLTLLGTNEGVASGGSEICREVLAVSAAVLPNVATITSLTGAGAVACSSAQDATAGMTGITISAPWNQGEAVGRMVGQLDLSAYRNALSRRHATRQQIIAIVTPDGGILAQSRALPWQDFPAQVGPAVVQRRTGGGEAWLVTRQPLQLAAKDAPRLTLVAVQRDPGLFGPQQGVIISLFVIPLLAILLASLVLWVATNWVLLRWIDRLRDAAARIGAGQHRLNAEKFNDAPDEIRSLASSMQTMARTMAHRSAGLKYALAQQRATSLELHHRVKNNLQIVGSYLSLRGADMDGATQLANAQLRVAALSLVHRLLYEKGELVDIGLATLLTELGRLITGHESAGFDRDFRISIDKDAGLAQLDIDTATTTTLLLVEIADRLKKVGSITIAMSGDGKGLDMVIGWQPGPAPADVASHGLVAGFARQLGATLVMQSRPPALRLAFPAQRNFQSVLANTEVP